MQGDFLGEGSSQADVPAAPDWTADVLFAAMQSVVAPHSCCYVAGPLTSSEARLMSRSDSLSAEIESSNRARMRAFTQHLRQELNHPVIDSSILQVPGWNGSQYGGFFLRVMEELCSEVRFLDGWEYSMGATKEFVRAQELRVSCLDESGGELVLATGVELIQRVANKLGKSGIDNSAHLKRLDSLQRLM
jgi:hypothetical protein